MNRVDRAHLLKDYLRYLNDIENKEKEFKEIIGQIPPTITDELLNLKLLDHITYIGARLSHLIETAKTIMKIERRSIRILEKLENSLDEISEKLRASLATEVPFRLQYYYFSEFMTVRNKIVDKTTFQLAYGRLIPDKGKPYCFKTGVSCPKDITSDPDQFFIAMPFIKKLKDIYQHGIVPILEKYSLKPWKADQKPSTIDIMCKICEHLQESQYAIVNITDWNPNVLFELGLAYGLGKTVVLIKDKESSVPVDLKGMEYLEYESSEDLKVGLENFIKSNDYLKQKEKWPKPIN